MSSSTWWMCVSTSYTYVLVCIYENRNSNFTSFFRYHCILQRFKRLICFSKSIWCWTLILNRISNQQWIFWPILFMDLRLTCYQPLKVQRNSNHQTGCMRYIIWLKLHVKISLIDVCERFGMYFLNSCIYLNFKY